MTLLRGNPDHSEGNTVEISCARIVKREALGYPIQSVEIALLDSIDRSNGSGKPQLWYQRLYGTPATAGYALGSVWLKGYVHTHLWSRDANQTQISISIPLDDPDLPYLYDSDFASLESFGRERLAEILTTLGVSSQADSVNPELPPRKPRGRRPEAEEKQLQVVYDWFNEKYLTREVFCEKNGISSATLSRWTKSCGASKRVRKK